jgi:hypothetical protein
MNCCDANGDCQQGDNCPVRKQMTEERMKKVEGRLVSWISDPALGLLLCTASAAGVISLMAYLFYRFAH